jgi:hypothetical protein
MFTNLKGVGHKVACLFKQKVLMFLLSYCYLSILFLFLSISEVFCAAALAELYLVVGSNKIKAEFHGLYLESYHHHPAADFVHKRTFDGEAITLDLDPDYTVPGRHFPETDACSFVPEAPIAVVFMELFPSHGVRTVMDLQRMEVAQDPSLSLKMIKEFSANLVNCPVGLRNSIVRNMLTQIREPYEIDDQLMPHAIENLAKHMKPNANLYIEHIPLLALEADNCFSLNVPLLFLEELRVTITEPSSTSLCRQAVDLVQAAMEISTGEIRLTREEYFDRLTAEVELCVTPEAFHQSLSLVVLLELERLEQSLPDSPINKFLAGKGFVNINHQRVINPFNGRSNSWMISAVKA